MISAIVAVDNNWGIGFNDDLLEHIPDDLKYFKQLTSGHNVIMGRKTWDSLPTKPLPNRGNYIISSEQPRILHKNAIRFQMDDALTFLDYTQEDVFVIGGGQIYKKLLPYCDRVYITKIYKGHNQVDTYFPNLDESDEWAPATCSDIRQQGDLTYQFWQYDRI